MCKKAGVASVFLIPVISICVGLAVQSFAARGSNVRGLKPGSLCESTENIVFACTIRKPAKIVSLCSSKDLTNERGYLQYRFGLPEKIELEFPKQREQTQSAFKYSHYFRAQVDLTEISFSQDGYEYAIFDDYSGEQKPARHEQGIKITAPGNGKELILNCRGRAKAHYADLKSVLGEEPD